MRVSPIIITIFLAGIFINSLGRLVLTPLHYPVGLQLTTIGYIFWASSYLYITIYALVTKRFNAHLAFWFVFTVLAPIQYMAAAAHHNTLNHVTAAILIAQLSVGSFIETRYWLQRRQANRRAT